MTPQSTTCLLFHSLVHCGLLLGVIDCALVLGQSKPEGHAETQTAPLPAKPRIFLDKSPRIVEYQLKRLSNAQLLMVDRGTDHVKYAPVYSEILIRSGMPASDRQQAAESLATIRRSTYSTELLSALELLDATKPESQRVARDLSNLVLNQAQTALQQEMALFTVKTTSQHAIQRRVAFAAMIAAGQIDAAGKLAETNEATQIDFLAAIPWVQDVQQRNKLRALVIPLLADNRPVAVQRQAIETLASIPDMSADTFRRVAEFVGQTELTEAAIRTLQAVPLLNRDTQVSQLLAVRLLEIAEKTPVENRTSDRFVDLTELLESLLASVSPEQARDYRQRMRDISVRLVRIRTVEEEMRYDVKFFAVEAGRPVQLMLQNDDLMPHNLVITQPGALKEIALQAATMAPDQATGGKQYVPQSDKVIIASSMVAAGRSERLTFDAPRIPGEYPYVCTFPNHWMRMYGVMVVVPDVDAWQRSGKPPADPIGNNRSFVKNWKTEDLQGELTVGLRGRDPQIGSRIFQDATCGQCHKIRGTGGSVGPDLSDLTTRWKGDHIGVLREVLDPSHKIDPKYSAHSILTDSGKVFSGVIVAEDTDSISLISTPDQKSATRILRKEIGEMVKSSKSLMPNALMDQFTKDEIFELLAYLVLPLPEK